MLLKLAQALIPSLISLGSLAAVAGPPDAEQLIKRHLKEASEVWADGNNATFFYRGELEEVILEFGREKRPLARLPMSDVWTLVITLPELERAIFSYRLMPKEKGRLPARFSEFPRVWRGARAPLSAIELSELRGQLKTVDMQSNVLHVRRRVTVYLPPGHDKRSRTSVVYATDGEHIGRFAGVLEPLIVSGKIRPVVIVGVHSGGYVGGMPELKDYDPEKDFRLQEYVPGINPQRFSEHEAFFCTELLIWAEREFDLSSDKGERAVFGYSNGGRFAVEMGLRHPELFGHIFGFSVAGDGQFHSPGSVQIVRPSYYLVSGIWEESFHRYTSSLAEGLERQGVSVKFASRIAGHDSALWREEFAEAVRIAFEKR